MRVGLLRSQTRVSNYLVQAADAQQVQGSVQLLLDGDLKQPEVAVLLLLEVCVEKLVLRHRQRGRRDLRPEPS